MPTGAHLTAVLVFVMAAPSAFAQCSMCRTAAEAAGSDALNAAILALFVPAMTLFGAIVAVAFRAGRHGGHHPTAKSENRSE